MEKANTKYVTCAHCEKKVPLEEAVRYQGVLVYGEHYHCRDCDPDGDWDCLSTDLDLELH